jgi:hypothetical protein
VFFYLFLRKSSFQIPDYANLDFFRADFLTFCEKSGSGGRPTVPDFFGLPDLDPDFQISCQIFYVFPCVVESSDLSTRKQHHILAPWTPIAKPEEVMADALGQQSTKS